MGAFLQVTIYTRIAPVARSEIGMGAFQGRNDTGLCCRAAEYTCIKTGNFAVTGPSG